MDKKDGEEQFGGEKQGGKEGWRRVVRKEKQAVIGSRVERREGAGWKRGREQIEKEEGSRLEGRE